MKLSTKFLRVSVMLCLLVWMTHPTVKETAQLPKTESPKITLEHKASKRVDQKRNQHSASSVLAATQRQVFELAPALKWLRPYLAPASDRARGQKFVSPFVPSITATKTVTQFGTDLGTPGATPGDVLRYVVVIENATGAMDAAAVQFADQIDANTTLVPGSLVSAPIAIDDSYSTVGNTSISVPAASGLIANDVNLNGTPMSATAIDQTGTMGTVVANPDGSFTFNPNPGFTGTTTFTYTVSNGAFASVGTVTITVTGLIWYIDDSAAAGGDGRLNTPFNSINAFNATSLDEPGDNIFVYSGTYTNTISTLLLGQQKLIGQGAVGASLAALAGVTFSVHPPISPATIPTVNGTRPEISQAANNTNMQSQNQLRGVNITNTGGTALLGSGFTSALVREVTIKTTGGAAAVNFNAGALDAIFTEISASNAAYGIRLAGVTGTFTVTGTSTTDGTGGVLSNISTRGIEIIGTSPTVSLSNMTLTGANTTDGGGAGVCDEVNNINCNAAIYLQNISAAGSVTLTNVDITTTEEHGINANNINNLVLSNCTSNSNGNNLEENALKLRNVFGTCSISNCSFTLSAYRIFHLINTSGSLTLTVSNTTFNNTITNTPGIGQDCFEARTQGTATATINLTNSSFQRARTKGIQAVAEGTSTLDLNVNGCAVQRFAGLMAGIEASSGDNATMNHNITNCTAIEAANEVAVLSTTGVNSKFNGRVNSNVITQDPAANFSADVVRMVNDVTTGQSRVEIKNNTITTANSVLAGIIAWARSSGAAGPTLATSRLDATIDNNTINTDADLFQGIAVQSAATSTDVFQGTACGNVLNNDIVGSPFDAADYLEASASAILLMQGAGAGANESARALANWAGNGNTPPAGPVFATATGSVTYNSTCLTPAHATFTSQQAELLAMEIERGLLEHEALLRETPDKKTPTSSEPIQAAAEPKAKAKKTETADVASLQMVMAGETVTVGAPSGFPLPAGKKITIRFDVTINSPLPGGVCQISNQGSVSGSNFTTILTDNVAGGSVDPTVTQLSKHSLGNLVFRDNNKNGLFDGGDAGILGVVVNLYRDNGTTPGILDASDAFVTTTNTAAGGLYLFSNLCSDEYIVQIPSTEFGALKPLNGLISSPTGAAADPDNDTDNDDNGQNAISSSIASQAITLSYSTSFVENNTTLDFGFKSPTNVSINDVTMNEGSGGGTTTFTFTVTRDDNSEAFNLDVNTGVISTNNGDYTAISGGTVSFIAGGSNTATVTVVVNADDIVELTETFNVLLSNAPAGVVITDGTGLGTITNDDQATLSINSVANNEGNSGTQTYTFTVTSDKAVDVPFSVNIATANSSATTADNDYVANSTTLNFAGTTAGETKTFDVTVNGDMKVEPTETFTVPLSTVSATGRNVVISGPSGTGTGTITNDDSATISIDDVSLAEGNAGTTNFTFTVSLSKVVSTAVTVNFTTANGTANGGGADYNNNSGMVTFPANGAGQTQQITVQVIGDVVGEANETFFVNLSNVVGSPDVSILDAQGVGTILDDDLSFSINDVAIAEGNAGTTNLTFTVTRTSTTTIETINYQTADNTATTGDNDYVAKNGTLNFAIGDATEDITIVINGDNIVEATETFLVNLSAASNGSIANAQGVGTITNDDLATITLSGGIAQNEGNAGTTSYIFTATLDKAVAGGLSVPFNTNNGTATTADNDYQDNDGTLTFAGTANEIQTITVLVNGDTKIEANETFTVSLGTITGTLASAVSAAGSPQTGTITNDDAATVTLAPISATANEGNAGTTNFTFSVTLDNPVAGGFDLAYTTNNGTATTGDNDYVDNDNTLSFAGTVGESKTITVQVNGDTKVEASETFSVALGALSGTTLSSSITLAGSPQTGTITNDDAATVTLAPISASANEGNAGTTNRTFSVTLDNPVAGGFNLAYTTSDGTATTADNDYVDNDNTLSFAGTVGESKTITVQVNGDTKVEANETFSVALGALSATTLSSSITLAGSPQTGTITNDDAATVTLAPISASANEGNAGTTNRTFSVTLDNPVAGGFDLAYTTNNGTATTADNDYLDNDNTLSFAGTLGESKTITVQVNGDTKVEANETFSVALGALSGTTLSSSITLAGSPQTGTITNDDAATVTLAPISATANEGNAGTTNLTFSVTLDNPVAGGFNLAYTTNDGTATTGDNDYLDNDNTLSFAGTLGESKTITVQVNGDTKVEANETFSVVLGALSGTTLGSSITLAGSPQTGTITNDDAATISINDVSKIEGSSGACTNVFDFTVTLNNVVGTAVTVDWAVSGGTASSGSDYSGTTSGTVTFPANGTGQTQHILINVCEDVVGEANETFNVNLSNILGSASVTFADAQGLGTIEDDDLAFSINDVSIAEGNAGTTNLTFTVTRTSTATVETIQYATANNTATTADNDYASTSGTLNFGIGDDTETFTVVVNGDLKVEANETFFANLSNASNGNISDAQGVGTINNDDAAVVHLQLLSATKAEGNVGTTNFTFTATLNNPVQGGFDLAYTTDDATATTANNDYQDNDGTLSFTGTANEQKIITVLVNGDTDVELDETFTVSIENNGFSNTALAASLSTASTVIATIQNDDSDIDAGLDTTICASTIMIPLKGTVNGASTGGTWTTSGTGTFIPNANTLNAKYMFTAADTAAGVINLTLTGNGPSGEFDVKIVTIDPAAIVNAGPDQTICAADTIYLSATLSGVATNLVWQKNAAFGTFIGPDTSPNAKYVLNATGMLLSSLKFGVMTNDPGGNVCQGGLDTVQIFINPKATVDAGPDRRICASQDTIHLNGSFGGAATGATWSGGTGTFSPNTTTLNAVYTFTAADTAANVVKLYLTTNDPSGLCGPAKDSIIITIDPEAIVNAGPDQTICAADTIYLSATLSGVATNLVWQKNAAFGTFVGPDTSPNAKYVLNATGMLLSSLKFGVMTNDPGGNVCQGGLDTVQIFINPKATVDAGPDRRICASQDTIHLNGGFGGAATGATWSGGTGAFTPNTTTLNAVYTFTAADTAANVVKLYLTTNDPTGLCGPAKDSIIVTIDPEAIVDAGPDQTVCATDTIYLHATLSGVATNLVWQKNAAFGNFVGSDTSPNAKYVLNATGQQLSSLKFGVMTNDPGGNVCQGGLDTVEIFISDPIDASVSIDLDTICVNGEVVGTFTESTLPPGSEFTLTIEYTDENGAGSITLTDVKSGDQQTFTEGVDFDGITTVNRIIVTPENPQYCSDTLDGFEIYVQVCEATIVDPCVCQNNAQIGQNGANSNTGTFKDIVRIEGPINQTWTVASVSGLYEDAAGTNPVDVGDAFIQVSPGVYELVGYHIDAIGYTISVTNGRGVTLEANNKCFYPNPVFTGLPALVAPSAAPFKVTGTVADNVAGTGTFILDGVPQAGVSPAPTVLTINPGTLAPGPHTLVYSFDAGVAASKDSLDPGCVQQVRQRFQVANCGCQDVTVSLDANCQFLLTGNLVSDVNCNGGTVRVMDNNPSNGGLIDCAGVWTYGLFDSFGNIICWGKVTAEDKTAPALVCAPADITLDCYDVNYVLNNRLTIGNVGATSSPRPAATSPQTINNAEGVAGTGDNCQLGLVPPSLVSDNIKNLGYAYFKDNCYNCGCRITLKWSDKVEFYSCEQMKVNGGYYAVISREWTATDCNGMRSSYVQKIKFTRPAIDDFVFNGPGEGKYDRVVEYNSCTPDKSLIKKEDVTPYVCSYFNTSANPRCLFIDQVECNYSVSIKDTEFPICGGKGVKIDRELYVLDWCAGGIVDTFHILIKIGDFQAPTVEYAHGAPFDISTGPMDCTAAIPVSVAGIKSAFGVTIKDNCNLGNISVSVYTKDRYVKGILVYEGPANPICTRMADEGAELRGDNDAYRLGACKKEDICWDKVEYAVMNGMMVGLPVGKHLMVIDAFDGCYNASTTCFVFEVKDKIAPIMKCDDDLHVTLSNANGYTNGFAQVSAEDIDEGSWDNCKLSWIAVRRNVPDGCAASFIAKGYDTNGNGKLDALPADGDVTKADGFDRNGDGDIADFGETFILKGGKLMTPLLDFVEFFCCDLTERVTVELWGGDIYGNTNYCWMDLLIEDKVAPTCLAPWDVTVYCDDKNLASIDSKAGSAAAFGDVIIPSGNDCAALDTVYSTEKKLKCGAGYIDRIWTLTKQTVKGPISVTCKQRIYILPVHEYNICFPKDVSTDCKTPIIDTVITDELGCDILAVNVHDKRYDASDDECYKIFRTYSVINWCTYDDRCGDPLLQTNISIIDRAVFGNYGKAPIYVLVRDRKNNRRDGIEEFWISKDLVAGNADDIDFTNEVPYCSVAGEFYHSFIYTQIIKVYDDTRPVVTGVRDTFCTSPTACTANITKVVTLKDNCTDKVELETQFLMIAPFQTLEAGKMILYSTPRWSTKDLGNGQFEIKVSNLPEGTHDLIVVGRDECGNLSLPTRIPFVVKDCKAPAPICINGLSVDLMPDGNGGGMMTVWATDFVASKIYDCNGQGPETKDGLKLITKYSVNRVKEPVNPNQTSISVNCADLELGFILVELHAWDAVGNHDFCVTFIEVQDNRKVCPAPADKVKIAGTIATEGAGNLQGVSVTLSGSGTQSDMTGTDGNYEFVNITKGGDFTVTPQLDKNHLNGVSTFDLVLIQKHILGVQALNSPYKMIAADANNSKSISTLDMIQIRKLILNIDTHFANNTSWRFVDATYRFPNPTNPWSASFPEVVSVNDLVTNVRANFVAIKVGDVNASASVNGAASAEIRTSEDFKLKTQEQNLKSGNEYKVSFTAEDLKNIQGYQFALNLDQSKVELLDIEYGVAKAEHFGVFKNEGIITTSWNSKYEPGALFTLVLRAKADAKLSQSLSLNRLVHPEAYDQNNENLGIALNFEGIQATEAYELKQNTPNPFSNETVIGFTLPKALKGTLTVRDVKGATIYKVEGNYAKGNNQVTLKKSQLGASGVLYYTLETTEFTATKKMVILE